MSAVRVEGLTVRFALPRRAFAAVDGVSFSVEEGTTLALVGESGCGKTMTALALLGLTPPTARVEAGEIRLAGKDLLGLSAGERRAMRGREVGMVFQDPATALNPVFTIGEQVAETLRAHERLPRREAWRRAVEQLSEVGIPDPSRRAREYPHQLSGGLKQRAVIAMAITCRPAFLIADEPTTALDVTVQAQVLDLLRALQASRRMALLLITHDLGVVAEVAHDVVVMYAGRVMEQAGAEALFAAPLHPYACDLLASMPRLTGPLKRLRAIEGTVPDLAHLPPGCAYEPRCSRAQPACRGPQELEEVVAGRWARCRRAKEWPSGCPS